MVEIHALERAKGNAVDLLGEIYNVKRKRWLWIIPEWDIIYRRRIHKAIYKSWHDEQVPLGPRFLWHRLVKAVRGE